MRFFMQRQQTTSSLGPDNAEAVTPLAPAPRPATSGILHLQRTIGNHAVQRLLGGGAKKGELAMGSPGDRYEQEADRVAEQVLSMPGSSPPVQTGKGAGPMQASPAGGAAASGMSSSRYLSAAAQPLAPMTRALFEPRFGYDFNHVRIHNNAEGYAAARSVNARAYTVGRDIVFAKGEYAPETRAGQRLLAHELTHVIQQGAAQSYMPLSGQDTAPRIANRPDGLALQLQDGPPPQTSTVTPQQQTYNDALARLQHLDSGLHGYLAAAPVDGTQTTIRTSSDTDAQGVTTTTNFRLTVRFQSLPNAYAVFQRQPVAAPTGAGNARTRSVDMTMLVDPPSGSSAVNDLTETLYHEGLHMLIHMDRFLPTAQQSPHGARAETYQTAARRHADYAPLLSELESIIQPHFRTQIVGAHPTEPVPPSVDQRITELTRQAAQSIVTDLIEEKYIEDTVAPGMGRARQANNAFALENIGNDLVNELGITEQQLVSGANRPIIQSIMARADRILTAIQQPAQAAPSPSPPSPAPAPGH